MGYPPTTLALLAPLALLHRRTALWTYLAGSTILLVFAVLVLARNLPYPWRDSRKLYLVAFALVMAP